MLFCNYKLSIWKMYMLMSCAWYIDELRSNVE